MAIALLSISATACTTVAADPPAPTEAASTTVADNDSTAAPSSSAAPTTNVPTTTTATPTVAPSPSAEDITVPEELRITPSQGEGPYYPVTKPNDRDNNLLVLGAGDPTTLGTPLEISGLLLYANGEAVDGATIEIWQVDGQGIYDHPRAPNTDSRDPSFQFYGESIADADGFWTFLTLDPVLYESRPRHIHVKVRIDGTEALTTQIYFDGDPLLDEDGLAAAAGDDLVLLTVNAAPGTLSNGDEGLIARHLIVLAE